MKEKAAWALGGLPACLLIVGGAMKIVGPPGVVEGFLQLGWSPEMALPLGIVELIVGLLYLIPRTAVLGAILVTGLMGGAIATHLRLAQPVLVQIVMGVLFWGSLYLRDSRVRELIPLRRF